MKPKILLSKVLLFCLVTMTIALPVDRASAAICKVGILTHDANFSQNLIGQYLLASLPAENVDVVSLTYDELLDSAKLNSTNIKMLIVPESPLFPVSTAAALHAYLKTGGSLITLGGDPFSRPLLKYNNVWYDFPGVNENLYSGAQAVLIADTPAIPASSWVSYKKNTAAASRVRNVVEAGKNAFLFEHRDNTDYDEFSLEVPEVQTTTANALLFYAKADGYTPQTLFRVKFSNGALCEYATELRMGWNTVCIPLSNMRQLNATVPPTTITGLNKIVFAMTDLRHRYQDHDVYISAVKGVKLPTGYKSKIEIDGLALCDDRDVYQYDNAVTTVPYPSAPVSGFTANGNFTGISALGFPYYGEQSFIPLLEAQDLYNRRNGWAAGIVMNQNGIWKDSKWAIFGIKEASWYQSSTYVDYLAALIAYMLQPTPPASVAPAPTPPAPTPMPRLSIINGSFEKPDGTPFFVMGENLGSILYGRPLSKLDDASLHRLFSQLSNAGVNALRILNPSIFVNQGKLSLLSNIAEQWGIYLLVGATPAPFDSNLTKASIEAYSTTLATVFKDKSVLLGYDLRNEAYVHEVKLYTDDSGTSLEIKYPYSQSSLLAFEDSLRRVDGHGVATFYGFNGVLARPSNSGQATAYDAVNNIFGEWIGWFRNAFTAAGDTHPLTVGFNYWYAAMPVGDLLDFTNQHTYVFPTDYGAVVDEITILDRLHGMFPDKPKTWGEYGYTDGYIVQGKPLSAQAQAAGETMHLLYAWAKGYSGGFDWQVYDYDPVYYDRINNWSDSKDQYKKNYERFHGMYTWDGTPEGMMKPYGLATKFFSDAVAAGLGQGSIDLYSTSTTQIGAGYIFSAPNGLFVGDSQYTGSTLSFSALEERTVGMYWNPNRLKLMSTGDVMVTLYSNMISGITIPPGTAVSGNTGSYQWNGDSLQIQLLAGESVTIMGVSPATVTLSNLNQTYNGSPRPATVTTDPSGLSCLITYNGSSTAPTNTGSYAVVATITDPSYTGSASGTLVVAKAAATVTLGSLSQTYNGSPRVATATTSPAGLSVSFTYDGSGTAPTNTGSYAVVGTINDTNYTGSASGTLVVAKATATVTLGSLSQTYNGSPRVVTATTSPAGLSVSFTYNGSGTAPTNAGSYAVVGTINNTNYTGSASGTLVVAKATATVTLGSLTHTYDGTPKSATATTSPAGLSVSFTYNGSGTAPSAVGSYAVVGTINDTNYTGSASGTMVIAAAPTTVTFISVLAHDGYVLESNETSNVGGTATTTGANASALRTGDNNTDKQYKSFVSFDTASIPDGATITAVTLRLKRGALTGQNPFATHGACRVDIVGGSGFGGAVTLVAEDFQAAAGATQVATMSDPVSNGSWSTGAVNAAGLNVVNKTGHSQLRVYFATDDNDDTGNDYIGWYSGEAAAGNQPELIVTYQ